jgi:DNA-binding response OmpR family regulator
MSAILLVDDNPAVRNVVGDVLRDSGHAVMEAASGSAALSLLERNSFDLLILDYLLPDMKGDAIARIVRERWSNLRIAFLSAYADFLSVTGKNGDDIVIPKPISVEALCIAVEAALRSEQSVARAA